MGAAARQAPAAGTALLAGAWRKWGWTRSRDPHGLAQLGRGCVPVVARCRPARHPAGGSPGLEGSFF